MRFKPVFSRDDVAALADRYLHPKSARDRAVIEDEKTILKRTAPGIRRRGYVQLEELKAICRWKSTRSARHVGKNDPLFVRETTHAALATRCDRLRIEVLTLLDGVEWPTASVLLHFAAADPTRRNEAAYHPRPPRPRVTRHRGTAAVHVRLLEAVHRLLPHTCARLADRHAHPRPRPLAALEGSGLLNPQMTQIMPIRIHPRHAVLRVSAPPR